MPKMGKKLTKMVMAIKAKYQNEGGGNPAAAPIQP